MSVPLTEPSVVPTSVHPLETKPTASAVMESGLLSLDPDLGECWRHSGWAKDRRRIYDAIRATNQSTSRTMAFVSCGSSSHVYRTVDPPYVYRIGGSSCHDRFCLPCARERSAVIADNVHKALLGKPTRFLTLTLKPTCLGLAVQLDRLYECFRMLRKTLVWRKCVAGGCAFLEVIWSDRSQDWHAHLHVLIHGSYLPHDRLKAAWYLVTGDSMIVDIRLVRDERTVGRYITKYVSKPLNQTFLKSPDKLCQVIAAYRNRRTCLTFGDWRGICLTEVETEGNWESIGTLEDFAARLASGDAEAERILATICHDRLPDLLATYESQPRPPPIVLKRPSPVTVGLWTEHDPRF